MELAEVVTAAVRANAGWASVVFSRTASGESALAQPGVLWPI